MTEERSRRAGVASILEKNRRDEKGKPSPVVRSLPFALINQIECCEA